jgi:hypothetical protein
MLVSSTPRFDLLQVRDYKFDPEDGAIATLVFDGLGLFIVPDTVVCIARTLFLALLLFPHPLKLAMQSKCKVKYVEGRLFD